MRLLITGLLIFATSFIYGQRDTTISVQVTYVSFQDTVPASTFMYTETASDIVKIARNKEMIAKGRRILLNGAPNGFAEITYFLDEREVLLIRQ